MKKSNTFIKLLLIFGVILTLVGGIIFTVAMTASKWDFSVLASHLYQKKVVELTEEQTEAVSKIKIEMSTADVKIEYHDGQKIIVEGFDVTNLKGKILRRFTTSVSNGELSVTLKREKSHIFSMGTSGDCDVTVKLPKEKVVDLSVDLSTGDVIIGEKGKDYKLGKIEIEQSTGDTKIEANVECSSLDVDGSTGDVFVNGNLKVNSLEVETSTGELYINAEIEAQTIEVELSSGKVICGSFITASKIDVETSTGDVTLKLLGSRSEYNYSYEASTGESNIYPMQNAGATKTVRVTVSTGDIYIYFER